MIPQVSPAALRAALISFDREYRFQTAWQGWEQKPTHRLAIQYEDRRYPARQIVALATGQPPGSLGDNEVVQQYAQQRGFSTLLMDRTSSPAPLTVPYRALATPVQVTAPHPVVVATDFATVVTQCSTALYDEIRHLRKNGGQKIFLTDGQYLGRRDERYSYTFTADGEIRFPDDTTH